MMMVMFFYFLSETEGSKKGLQFSQSCAVGAVLEKLTCYCYSRYITIDLYVDVCAQQISLSSILAKDLPTQATYKLYDIIVNLGCDSHTKLKFSHTKDNSKSSH